MGKIHLQMYSFMDGTMNDTKENLKNAAKMGYDGVELFGPNMEIPAEEMKSTLEEMHLEPVSMHVPKTDMIPVLLPYAKAVGMKFIGIGMEVMIDEAAVHAFAQRLNELGALCAEEGLMLTYHNHTQEFLPCGDARVIDVLLKETNPEHVSMELDAGWCAAAGFDPIEFVKRYSGRVKLIHVKESSEVIGPQQPMDFDKIEKDEMGMPIFPEDMKAEMERSKKINCLAGEGLVDWKALKETADAHGCQAYIVEREYTPHGTRLEVLKQDVDYYKTVM